MNLRSQKLEQSADDVNEQGEQKAKQDHGGNGKVKPEILLFHPDIARQAADPGEFVVEKIDQEADYNNNYSKANDIFSCVLIHFLQFTNNRPQIIYLNSIMKTIFLFLLSFTLCTFLQAQDSWKATLHGKSVLSTSTEDPEKNIVPVNASSLKNSKSFVIAYTETEKQNGWQRTITAYDSTDRELIKQSGTSFKLSNKSLLSLLKKCKTVRIFTMYLPTDPKIKASVRVRRVHLCTLTLR
jgi:hypothetical protein